MPNPIKILNSKFLTVGLVLFVAIFSLSLIRVNSQRLAINKEIKMIEEKIENSEKEKEYLEKTVSFLTDKSFLERQARIKFNYKYSDEEVAFIYPSEATITTASELKKENLPNLVKWWNFLVDIK